jgi:predicted HTH transcriptional regulator
VTGEEIRALVEEIQRVRSELQAVEVKTAARGTPGRALRESLSAFSNRTGGGVVLLGLDEAVGFAVTEV